MDIHDIQRFTIISQPFSEFCLGPPYGDHWASSAQLCPPGSNL